MKVKTYLVFKCRYCGGYKYIGDEYYCMSKWYVDITCINCSHSKDIEVEELLKLCHKCGDKNATIIE